MASGPAAWISRGDEVKPSAPPPPSALLGVSEARSNLQGEIEKVRLAAHSFEKGSPAHLDALEQGLRELRLQHPIEPAIYVELLALADERPGESGLKLAREILEWQSPERVKEKARGVVRKRELLGAIYPIRLAGIDGRMLETQRLRGKVVLIDFWATWCAPCREGLPKLKALLASRQSKGLEILGVNFDESPKSLRRFLARESVDWPQHCAVGGMDGAVAREFGLTRLPTLWLIDREGRLRDLDARVDLEGKIDRLLSEPIRAGAPAPFSQETKNH